MAVKILSGILIFFVSIKFSFSQNSKWENFTDFKNVTSVAVDQITSNVYCASRGGLFVVDDNTGKVKAKYSNLNGLINNDLTSVAIDNQRKLWIGASDGSISILNLSNSSWKYIYDIKNSSESNKTINFLYPLGNYMFIATGYGIQKVSTSNFSFVDAPYYKLGSLPTNVSVSSLTSNNNVLYAATIAGIAYGNFLNSNLNDPNSWIAYSSPPLNNKVKTIEAFDNKIFAGSESGFGYFDGTSWLPYPNSSVSSGNTKFIKSINDLLYFISNTNIYFANKNDLASISQFQNSNNYSTLSADNNSNPIAGLSDNGVLLNSSGSYELIFPNSPFSNIFNQITIDSENNIWAAGGANGFYKFDGTNWTNYNTTSFPQIGNSNNFLKIASGNENIWALGFGGGVTLLTGNVIKNYNPSNSILPGAADPNFCASYGGAYDNNQIFWVSFFATNSGKSLFAYLGNDEWIGFLNPSGIGSASLSEIAVDSYNTKWIVMSGSRAAVYFFNENGTLTNQSDDVYGFYDNSDMGAEVTNIYDVIVDKNNEVWIATNNGIFIINNPLGAVQNPAQKPPTQKLGIISGNLKVPFTENCISLTNDILNDKWVGTETNGVFHLSSDGSTLIAQYNTSKSPILSNSVKTISVSNKTGRAYFGSLNGLSSFATDAIEPVADFDKIIVSPNPYLVPSDVNLKIDGLVENSTIKILTLSGDVITEFDSPGGRIAVWNGMTQDNSVTPSGIYIIAAFNKDGSKVGTGKVAIIKK